MLVGATVIVPVPSAAFVTFTDGELPIAVNDPALVDFSRTLHVAHPDCAFDGAEAPVDEEHAPVVAPYVIVNVAPCANVTLLTVITWPLTPTVPELDVVQPAFPFVVDGADQFAGTVNSTAP